MRHSWCFARREEQKHDAGFFVSSVFSFSSVAVAIFITTSLISTIYLAVTWSIIRFSLGGRFDLGFVLQYDDQQLEGRVYPSFYLPPYMSDYCSWPHFVFSPQTQDDGLI